MALSKKTGGRKAGTPNKKTQALDQLLQSMDCDPREIMALIALNKLPCGTCRGKGQTLYRKPMKPVVACPNCGFEGEGEEKGKVKFVACPKCNWQSEQELAHRICMSCYGSLMESCSPALRGQMSGELLQYQLPKRKAIEVSGSGGGPVEHRMELVFVEGKEGKPA